MFRFLNKKYPFNSDPIHNAKIIFFISVVFGLFLFFFQPFNIGGLPQKSKLTVSFIFAVITFAVLSFNLLVLPSYLVKIFRNENWKIFKEIIWNTWLLGLLATSYFFYFRYANIVSFDEIEFAKIVLIGIIPITILVFLNQNRLLRQNISDAMELNKKILSKINSEDNIVLFESDYKKDSISLTVSSIISIKSAGNYIEIYWKEKIKANKNLVRMKLQEAEEILKNYNFIFKCHRTYLINTNFVESAEGNSQGLILKVSNLDFKIPVSRPYVAKLKEVI